MAVERPLPFRVKHRDGFYTYFGPVADVNNAVNYATDAEVLRTMQFLPLPFSLDSSSPVIGYGIRSVAIRPSQVVNGQHYVAVMKHPRIESSNLSSAPYPPGLATKALREVW